MVIDNSGNVGIGPTGPGAKLEIYDTSAAPTHLKLTHANTGAYASVVFYEGATFKGTFQTIGSAFSDASRRDAFEFIAAADNTSNINFQTKTSGAYNKRMVITNSGNVGIGTTGPGGKFQVAGSSYNVTVDSVGSLGLGRITSPLGPLHFGTDTANNVYFDSSASSPSNNYFFRASRGTLAAPTAVQDDNQIAVLYGQGYQNSGYRSAAAIGFLVDGTPSGSAVPGRIGFYTTVTSISEKMRLHSSGSSPLYTQHSCPNILMLRLKHLLFPDLFSSYPLIEQSSDLVC